jgi:hypothetical protein
MVDENESEVLNSFYNKLERVLIQNNIRIIKKSILITLLDFSQGKIHFLLDQSTIDPSEIVGTRFIKNLLENGYIRESDNIESLAKYSLTAKGIWENDIENNSVNINDLIEYINSSKFSFSDSQKPFSDKEKVIIFTMLATRVFSQDITLDLREPKRSDYWKEIFIDCNKYLCSSGIISAEIEFETKGLEHPLSYLLRHANSLSQKSFQIFRQLGNREYYLDIVGEELLPQEDTKIKLIRIFKKVLECQVTPDLYTSLSNFLVTSAHQKSIHVINNFQFINYSWDTVIKDALLETLL